MFVLFMSISQSIFVALAVREWFNMSRPISLVYIWGHYFLYLVDYLSYATYITIPSILLVMVILSRASCYAPPLFLLVLLFQSFSSLSFKMVSSICSCNLFVSGVSFGQIRFR